jgi:hypothetical protein
MPGNKFKKSILESNASCSTEDKRVDVTVKVTGDNLIFDVAYDTLSRAFNACFITF